MNTLNGQKLKHRPRVAKLRKELAAVIKRLRWMKHHPGPTARQIVAEAVRIGFAPPPRHRKPRSLYIGATRPNIPKV